MKFDVKKFIDEYNLKQKDLTIVLEMSEANLSHLAAGKRIISLERFLKLSEYYHIPLENLKKYLIV